MLAAKLARPVGPQERLELAPSGALREAAGDEHRHALPRDDPRAELREHRGERVPPRVVLAGGSGSSGGWTTTVARPPRGATARERLPASG